MNNDEFNEMLGKFIRERTRIIEWCIIGAIEQIEGRVPTNDEVGRHGERKLWGDGFEVFSWKGVPIVGIESDSIKTVDGKMTFEIKSVFVEP